MLGTRWILYRDKLDDAISMLFKWCKSVLMVNVPFPRSGNHAQNVSCVAMQVCLMIGGDRNVHCVCHLDDFVHFLKIYLYCWRYVVSLTTAICLEDWIWFIPAYKMQQLKCFLMSVQFYSACKQCSVTHWSVTSIS